MKSPGAFAVVFANPVGTNGRGNHKHNDIFLSIDFFMGVSQG